MKTAILNLAKARVPRYTSYPTAAQFTEGVTPAIASDWLRALPPDQSISLYLHVPFCRQVCWYCACNMKLAAREQPLIDYTADLMSHIDLAAAQMPDGIKIAHVHWGGGTPTSLPPALMDQIMGQVRGRFDLCPDAEIAVEIDPRTFDEGREDDLAALGTSRVSLGVQEFDPKVQMLVNRIQPYAKVCDVVHRLRRAGITGINFDLMYGLPGQTVPTITDTMEKALTLTPDRIALFGYAHVPWMAKRQTKIPTEELPGLEERLAQADAAATVLTRAGYVRVGLDHFVRPGDGLAKAMRDNRLVRNFQGYSDDPATAIVGLGSSAISSVPQGYFQNVTETGAWARAIADGDLPVARGVALTAEDRLRREIINDLMCYMRVDIGAVLKHHGRAESSFDDVITGCQALEQDGIVQISGRVLRVTEPGRAALRLVAVQFDEYASDAGLKAMYSAAV